MNPTTNRHPVDELADIRAERKRLDDREAHLREALLADGTDLAGSEHRARIVTAKQQRLDRELLEERFGHQAIAKCSKPITITTIRLIKNHHNRILDNQPKVGVTNVTSVTDYDDGDAP